MTHKFPPERDERNDSDRTVGPDGPGDDLVDKFYGPSQEDMEKSWEGYETGEAQRRPGSGGAVWKYVVIGVSVVVLAAMTLGIIGPLVSRSRNVEPARQIQPERVTASVLRVIDARTIVVRSGEVEQTVRLIGIESPPFGDTWYDFARQVSQSWIEGQDVLLESDERDADEQGRLLRYVYFENVMINAALIFGGLGTVETEHPNVRYNGFLAEMERQARESRAGIWGPDSGAPGTGDDSDARSNNTEASLRLKVFAGLPTS